MKKDILFFTGSTGKKFWALTRSLMISMCLIIVGCKTGDIYEAPDGRTFVVAHDEVLGRFYLVEQVEGDSNGDVEDTDDEEDEEDITEEDQGEEDSEDVADVDDENDGAVELEQAYIEHDLNDNTYVRGGLFLLPVGLLNLTHEPDTFYGVERNNVEKEIIPTTWWEAGAAVGGELAPGWNYELAYTSGLGLDADAGDFKIRSGRQKVSKQDASDPAYTASLRYTGVAGLEVGAAMQYQQDIYQGEFAEEIDAVLFTAHVAYNNGPFGLRALVASWDIDSNIEAIKEGAQTQEGWFIEPSYKVLPDLGLFTRYSEWDNQADGGGDTEFSQWDIGVNYYLEPNVVLKADYQFQDAPANQKELEGLNLGIGWSW